MAAEDTEIPRRRSVRSGATALIASVVLVLWVVLLAWIGIIAIDNETAQVVLGILFVATWVVVPVLIVLILVFAIIALLLNPVPGKIMGAVAVVLPFIAAALFWNSIGGFSEAFLGS
jgi:hypothetical protein